MLNFPSLYIIGFAREGSIFCYPTPLKELYVLNSCRNVAKVNSYKSILESIKRILKKRDGIALIRDKKGVLSSEEREFFQLRKGLRRGLRKVL